MRRSGAEARPGAEKSHPIDEVIAELAQRQEGRLTRAQLAAAGVSDDAIALRVASGRLVRLRRGVFAVGGGAETVRGRARAALLSVGGDGVLRHGWSGAAWTMCAAYPSSIDVTTPRRLRSRPGIRVHRLPLERDEVRHLHKLPLTSPVRTLFDLGTMLRPEAHLLAANEGFVKRRYTIAELRRAESRYAGRTGSKAFARLMERIDPEGRPIRSPLEARLNRFLRARGFPPWEQNAKLWVAGEMIEPDVLWRQRRVIVEADGRDPHLAPLTFASDRRRDRRLRVEGWEPVRVTSADLDDRLDELDADLRALLSL
jgi:very-short-patch-repair endonuclease